MNRKKVAWLLTVAMVATSVDSSVLVASGADFSADTAEIVQDFSAEPAEASENAEDTAKTEASADAADLTEENQDLAFEDENGGLSHAEKEEADGFTGAEVEMDGTGLDTFDSAISTQASGTFDSTMAESAIEVPYKEFVQIPESLEGTDVVVKFTAPKDGKYTVIPSLTCSYNADGNFSTYDSSFQECEVENRSTVTCKAGETYYVVINHVQYINSHSCVTVYPALESYELKNLPQMDYVLWDGDIFENLSAENAVISCTYSNGETEEFSNNDEVTIRITNRNNGYSHVNELGKCEISLAIYKHIGDFGAELYQFYDLDEVTVRDCKGFVQDKKDEALELTENTQITTDSADHLFKFVPEEDGRYKFSFTTSGGYVSRHAVLMDENGEQISLTDNGQLKEELEQGKVYYVAVKNISDNSQSFTVVKKMKAIDSITANTPEICKNTGNGNDVYDSHIQNEVRVTVHYTDGTSEEIGYYDATEDGEKLQMNMNSVAHDEYGKIKEGVYTIPLSVDNKTTEMTLKVQNFADYCNDRATELTFAQQTNKEMDERYGSYYFKLTVPEDGFYKFDYHAEKNGEEVSFPSYNVGYYDSEGNHINETFEAKSGDVIYVIVTNGYDTGYDFCINSSQRDYILKKVELVSEPTDKKYVEYMDYTYDYNIIPKTEGLQVKAIYSDGVEEILKPEDISRDDKSVSVSIGSTYEYDETVNGYRYKLHMYASLDGLAVDIPLNKKTIGEYISENKSTLKAITPGVEEPVEWTGINGFVYRFTPSEGGDYTFLSTGDVFTFGCILDENGQLINSNTWGGSGSNFKLSNTLEGGKTYYYVARPYNSGTGTGTLKLAKKRVLKEISLSSDQADLYLGMDNLAWYAIRNLITSLKVTLKFEDGTEELLEWEKTTEDGYRLNYSVPDDMEAVGEYKIPITCDEISTTYTIKVHSAIEYITQHAREIPTDERTAIKLENNATQAYCVEAPETSYYKVDYLSNVKGEVTYYDAQGNSFGRVIKAKKGEKFYFTLNNNTGRTIKALITVSRQESVLEKLTIKTMPEKISLVENIDYEGEPDIFKEDYVKGLVVTAQYTDGTTEDLKFGENGRYGDKVSGRISCEYSEEGDLENCFIIISMADVAAEPIQMELTSLQDYLKKDGESLGTLTLNKMKNIALEEKKYQFFGFTAEKNQNYIFYSTGTLDTYGRLYDKDGVLLSSDDDSGVDNNFRIKYELKAGERYYLAVKGFSGSGRTMIGVSDRENQDSQNPDETLKLSDFQLVSAPEKTVFYNYNHEGMLEIGNISYKGLQIRAKDEDGKIKVYSYSYDEDEFPFSVKANIDTDEDDQPLVGKYTAEVFFQGEKAAEFQIEVKDFADYLTTVTTVLNPGDGFETDGYEPMDNGKLLYFKLPSDLDGVYWNAGEYDCRIEGIYDSLGNLTDMDMNGIDPIKTNGKDYYLCVGIENSGYRDSCYAKMESDAKVQAVEIISQPEVTRYVKGMESKIDLSGMLARVRYADGSLKTVGVKSYTDMYGRKFSLLDKDGNPVSSAEDLILGENELTLKYCDIEKTFKVTLESPVQEKADVLKPGEETRFAVTESEKYHVYAYTSDTDCDYVLSTFFAPENEYWWDEEVYKFVTDSQGNYVTSGNSFSMKAGETYYIVVYFTNDDIFDDVSVQLSKKDNVSDNDAPKFIELEVTSPTKTEYASNETVSYEGMKIHAIYDDGSEKDFTPEDAEENGLEVYDNVKTYNEKKYPGTYEITVSGQDCYGYNVMATVPITVTENGMQTLELSDQLLKVQTKPEGNLYRCEVKSSGYYQLGMTVENGDYAEFNLNGDYGYAYSQTEKAGTVYSSIVYLEAGAQYLYLSGSDATGTKGGNCKLKIVPYSAEPISIELIKGSIKTDFVCGQNINFAGAQFKVTFADGTEQIVTIPEDYVPYRKMETGLVISDTESSLGKNYAYARVESSTGESCSIRIPYTVSISEDVKELENGKTETLTSEQLRKGPVTYKVTTEDGMQICELKYENADVSIWCDNGETISYWNNYNNSKEYDFLAENGNTYYIVVRQYENDEEAQEASVQFSKSKVITGLKALPEEGVEYYYGINAGSTEYLKLQLTYADGSTETVDGRDGISSLVRLKLEQMAGPGTYKGTLSLGKLKTSYSRTVQNPTVTEIKTDQYVELDETNEAVMLKFVPEKTQHYYFNPDNKDDFSSLVLKNADGATLSDWDFGDTKMNVVLTAGKTYYFEVHRYNLSRSGIMISDKPVIDVDFTNGIRSYSYTGAEIQPEFIVRFERKILTEGKDYQVTYANNINAGTATAKFTPVSDEIRFAEKTVTFEILPINLEETGTVIENIPDQTYTGKELTPEVKVTVSGKILEQDKDYEVSYRNNVEKGTAQVLINGIGNYVGEIVKTFEIKVPAPSTTPEPSKPDTPSTTPEPSKPDTPSVTPEPSKPDTPSVTPEPSQPATPSVTPNPTTPTPAPTQAPKVNIGNAEITGIGDVVYTGKALTPAPIVTYSGQTLKAGTDYDVTYSNNVKLGTATLKITGKGSYTGEKTMAFRICNKITYNLNKGTQNSSNKVTFCKEKVKLYNPTRKGYTFGGWYTDKKFTKKITSVSNKTTKNVTVYAKWIKVTKCSAPANVKLVNSKAKTMAISYQAVTGAKGYEISYATNAKFKGATKVLTKSKSKTIKKLKKGKTYYVRVRAYKMDSTGNKIFGSYSKNAKIKITK